MNKMIEIYLVIEQSFFISNGIDYAMPVDANDDINLFDNYAKALSYFEDRSEEICRNENLEMKDLSTSDEKIAMWKKSNGNRRFLKLITKTIL